MATSFFHSGHFILPQALFHSLRQHFHLRFHSWRHIFQLQLHSFTAATSFFPKLSVSFLAAYTSMATSFFHSSDFILPQALFHSFRQRFHLRFHSYRHIFQLRLHSFTAATSSFPKLSLSFIASDSAFIFIFIPSDIYFNCDFTLSRQRLHPAPSSLSFLCFHSIRRIFQF